MAYSPEQGAVTLKGPVDKLGLFQPLFARAGEIEEKGRRANKDDDRAIDEALQEMGVRP